jgi:hypothetical protein
LALRLDDLEARFAARRAPRLRRNLEITDEGLLLGAGTLLAGLPLDGEEARVLALLSAAFACAVSPQILDVLGKAIALWKGGEKFRAQLHLTYARLPPLTEEQAFALCAAGELLKEGMTPRALMKGLGLDCAALDGLEKYNPDQPRVPAGNGRASGRWGSGGGAAPQLIGHGQALSDISVEPTGGRQYAQSDEQPPLRRIHPDSTYESDQRAKGSLEYWRNQSTDQIIESLKPGNRNPLLVKPDGGVFDGNTRLKVLEERGVNANSLPRQLYEDLNRGLGGGGGDGGRHDLPPEE